MNTHGLLSQLAISFFAMLTITACGSTDHLATQPAAANNAVNAPQTQTNNPLTNDNQQGAKQQILNYAKADRDYIELVAKFKREEVARLDFDAIVRIYPLTSKYSPYANVEQAQKLLAFESMEQQHWDACLKATTLILEENYTSLTGHYGAMVCHSELGHLDLSEYHNVMLDGFMDTIWRSGDGKTPATAFYITSTNDLYAFVQLNGLMATSQSLVYYEQRPIDAIQVEDPQSMQESTWYFDVTAQFRRGIFNKIESRK